MKYDSSTIRETLLDKNSSRELLNEIIFSRFSAEAMKKRFQDETSNWPEDQILDLAAYLLDALSQGNLEIIHQYSESPIETIFLGALNLGMVMLSTETFILPFINFVVPAQSAPDAIRENRVYWRDLNEARRVFSQISETNTAPDFVDFAIEQGEIHPENRLKAIAEITIYQDMNVGNTYQLMPQARFPEIVISGHSVRSDILIWKPTDDTFNLIVECDGYKYHSSPERFSNDRARDRLLKSEGYDVLRFAGTEIYHRPIEVAAELVRYLFQNQDDTDSIVAQDFD